MSVDMTSSSPLVPHDSHTHVTCVQVFKRLHLGTVSFGTESFTEVRDHLTKEYENSGKTGTKVSISKISMISFSCILFTTFCAETRFPFNRAALDIIVLLATYCLFPRSVRHWGIV